MAHAQSSKAPSSSASAAAAVTTVVRETSHQLLLNYLKTVQAALEASNAAFNVEQDSQSFEQMRSNVSGPYHAAGAPVLDRQKKFSAQNQDQ